MSDFGSTKKMAKFAEMIRQPGKHICDDTNFQKHVYFALPGDLFDQAELGVALASERTHERRVSALTSTGFARWEFCRSRETVTRGRI